MSISEANQKGKTGLSEALTEKVTVYRLFWQHTIWAPIMSNRNTEILEEAYKKWHDSKGGTVEHWMSLMTDDVDFRSLAQGSAGLEFTENRKSKRAMKEYFQGLMKDFEMIHYTIDRYVTEGDTVVAVGRTSWKHRGSGKEFDTPKVDVVTFRDGKICSFFEYYDTALIKQCTL